MHDLAVAIFSLLYFIFSLTQILLLFSFFFLVCVRVRVCVRVCVCARARACYYFSLPAAYLDTLKIKRTVNKLVS